MHAYIHKGDLSYLFVSKMALYVISLSWYYVFYLLYGYFDNIIDQRWYWTQSMIHSVGQREGQTNEDIKWMV